MHIRFKLENSLKIWKSIKHVQNQFKAEAYFRLWFKIYFLFETTLHKNYSTNDAMVSF